MDTPEYTAALADADRQRQHVAATLDKLISDQAHIRRTGHGETESWSQLAVFLGRALSLETGRGSFAAELLATAVLRLVDSPTTEENPLTMTDQPHASAPIGFEPRTSIEPLWLHTIEMSRPRTLGGAVIVVDERYLQAVAQHVELSVEVLVDTCRVHAAGREVWLRLDRNQALSLLYSLRRDGFGRRNIPGAALALTELQNIVEHEVEAR